MQRNTIPKPFIKYSCSITLAVLACGEALALDNWQTTDLFQFAEGQTSSGTCIIRAANNSLVAVGYGNRVDSTSADPKHVALLRESSDDGFTWTVRDQLDSGAMCHYFGVAQAQSGEFFIAGRISTPEAPEVYHWVVRKASADLSSVVTVDSFQLFRGQNTFANAITIAGDGTIWVTGTGSDGTYQRLVTRFSSDGGMTWNTADVFPSSGKSPRGLGLAIATDVSGTVFVAGEARNGSPNVRMVVRKLAPAASQFMTIDEFALNKSLPARARSIAISPDGDVFVVGDASDSKGYNHWIVRRSVDGQPFGTVDDYRPPTKGEAIASGIGFDASGTVYVLGGSYGASQIPNWVIRKSTNRGTTFSISDSLAGSLGGLAQAQSLTIDRYGVGIAVGAYSIDSPGAAWISRKLSQ